MRRFNDAATGVEWTAALWCGSYGEVRIVFAQTGDSAVFTTMLEVESLAAGETLLMDLDDADLCQRLSEAEPWPS